MKPTSQPSPTKTQIVEKLLRRRGGASVADIQEQTGWKPHSVRVFLSGLRRKGAVIEREVHKSKGSAYRIIKTRGSQDTSKQSERAQ